MLNLSIADTFLSRDKLESEFDVLNKLAIQFRDKGVCHYLFAACANRHNLSLEDFSILHGLLSNGEQPLLAHCNRVSNGPPRLKSNSAPLAHDIIVPLADTAILIDLFATPGS